jgi:hypothetical protein
MSGKFKDVQAHIFRENSLAFYILCIGHSLNLVGVKAVECSAEAVNFYGFLQSLYMHFSVPCRRLDILCSKCHMPRLVRLLLCTQIPLWYCDLENSETKRGARYLTKKMRNRGRCLHVYNLEQNSWKTRCNFNLTSLWNVSNHLNLCAVFKN